MCGNDTRASVRSQDGPTEVRVLTIIECGYDRSEESDTSIQDICAVDMEETIFHDRPKLRVETGSKIIRVHLLEGTLNEIISTIDEVFEIYEQTSLKASRLKLDSLRLDRPREWTANLIPCICWEFKSDSAGPSYPTSRYK